VTTRSELHSSKAPERSGAIIPAGNSKERHIMRILLVEDERKVASFIARALRENAYAVDIAENGEKALELSTDVTYDAILLDVRLPGLSGIQVCRELRQQGAEAPVLMLTARSLVEQRVEGLDAGADDYLTKPFALSELLARVRALVRRGLHSGNAKLQYADLDLDRHRRRATRGKEVVPLTSKEFALLELFLLHAPEMVTRTEIIEHVWDRHFDSETNLVEVYVNRLRQKIDQNHPVKLIHTVRGFGYRLGASES
jgi:two-component system copper resistance phosphate regulon response regulator CusR